MPQNDLDQLKQKINNSSILSSSEKADWLFLLPRMKPEQLEELEKILSIQLPGKPKPIPPRVPTPVSQPKPPTVLDKFSERTLAEYRAARSTLLSADEAKPSKAAPASPLAPSPAPPPFPAKPISDISVRGVRPPLPPQMAQKDADSASTSFRPSTADKIQTPARPKIFSKTFPKSVSSAPRGGRGGPAVPPPRSADKNLEHIRNLTVVDLRAAPSIYVFLENLNKTIAQLKQLQVATVSEITEAFEQSPLYKAYLDSGLKLMDNLDQEAGLTRSEVEVMADFRTSLKNTMR